MRLTLFISFNIFLVQAAQAERFTSRLYSIDPGGDGAPHLLKFENGRTAFLEVTEEDLLLSPQEGSLPGSLLEVEVDERLELLSLASTNIETQTPVATSTAFSAFLDYKPTVLENQSSADTIFLRMNRRHQRASQCYNRAHVWAFEEHQQSKWKSMKLFLFFTDRYIRNYRYRWWFHVTPMARVGTEDFAMDRTFTPGPLPIKDWTDIFIYSKRQCPVVHKYSDYEDHQWTEDCYLIPVSMYFWQPRDIDRYERTGEQKVEFIRSEVNHAYWEAF